ncbi:hypothetical protein IFM89_029767 [Coptis chinensis]|uniref:diaminopimelate epimerase n=1 Tax=Coptis chinensis TaxID=261450 RepID=A0A835IEF6_9MAGN|nr:hypothetical protein IFM89_029767 [Coptis chinensis]
MAMKAAAIVTLPLTSNKPLHSLSHLNLSKPKPLPTFLISASSSSMSIETTPVKESTPLFLEQRASKFLHFVKYQGLGNDFILVDNLDSLEPKVTPEQAAKLCDRNFGVGADGVIFAMPGVNGTDYSMRIFNSDGSEPEMCGNGIRCYARFITELEDLKGKKSFTIHTGAGLIVPEIKDDGKVRVDMGQPILTASDVPTKLVATTDQAVVGAPLEVNGVTWNVTCVSMGNPHCITFGTNECQVGLLVHVELSRAKLESNLELCTCLIHNCDWFLMLFEIIAKKRRLTLALGQSLQVDDLNLSDVGPKFENHEVFPSRTNTEFVQVLSRSHLKMRVWERGAGATLACGTGACAVVVAAVLEGRSERSCTVDLPGGPLEIEWKEEDNHIYMTGPAEVVFYGSAPL